MTLHVTTLEEFAEAVRRILGHRDAYIVPSKNGSLLTAVHPERHQTVQCWVPQGLDAVKKALAPHDLMVHPGRWSESQEPEQEDPGDLVEFFVAAVSYKSAEPKPGLWLNAYSTHVTPMQAIQDLYEDFVANGELTNCTLDEFVRLAVPNAMLFSSAHLKSFIEAPRDC